MALSNYGDDCCGRSCVYVYVFVSFLIQVFSGSVVIDEASEEWFGISVTCLIPVWVVNSTLDIVADGQVHVYA